MTTHLARRRYAPIDDSPTPLRVVQTLALALALALCPAQAVAEEPTAAIVETLAEFAPGTFLENLDADDDGSLVLSSYFDKRLYRLKSSDAEPALFTELSSHPSGVLRTDAGWWISAHDVAFTEGPTFASSNRMVLLDARGEPTKTAPAPEARFLNGLVQLPGGVVLVADSMRGRLWRVNTDSGELTPWLDHDLLGPDPEASAFLPAVNGLGARGDFLYLSNSSRGAVYKTALNRGGERDTEAAVELYALTGPVDDFAIATDGTLYVTTHGEALLRITPDGAVHEVISRGCGGCTSAAFEPGADPPALIVLTTGGLLEGHGDPARILRVTGFRSEGAAP